jgi:hypothetical protein
MNKGSLRRYVYFVGHNPDSVGTNFRKDLKA